MVDSVIGWLNSPATPLWLKLTIVTALVLAVLVWLAHPPHWSDFEGPDKGHDKHAARPPR